jgi:hypothetical protein
VIGVCVPLGVIIIAVIAFIWWHRRRKARKAEAVPPSTQRAEPDLDPYTGKPELDVGDAVKIYMKQELDAGNEVRSGRPDAPAELPALETPKTPVAELAAANRGPDTAQAELPGEEILRGPVLSKANTDATSPSSDAGQRSSSTGRNADN